MGNHFEIAIKDINVNQSVINETMAYFKVSTNVIIVLISWMG